MANNSLNLTQLPRFNNTSVSGPICHLQDFAKHVGLGFIGLFIIAGVVGNSTVCFILLHMRRCLTSSTLHYVVSVAASDLLTCLAVMPFDILYWYHFPEWPLSPEMCKMWSALFFALHAASSLGIVAISMDTYITVATPLQSQSKQRVSSRNIIAVIWIWSFLVGVLIFVFQKQPPVGSYLFDLNPIAYGTYLIVHLVAPQIIAAWCYCKLFCISKVHAQSIQSHDRSRPSIDSSTTQTSATEGLTFKQKLRLAKTFLIVFLGYFICWNPFLAVQFIYVLKFEAKVDGCDLETADTVVCWLAYLQCCLNPFFYALRKNYFKELFKRAVSVN